MGRTCVVLVMLAGLAVSGCAATASRTSGVPPPQEKKVLQWQGRVGCEAVYLPFPGRTGLYFAGIHCSDESTR